MSRPRPPTRSAKQAPRFYQVTQRQTVDRVPGSDPKETMSGEQLLVIDDSPTVLKVVEGALARSGYRVAVASGGQAGVALARDLSPPPVLVLLDGDLSDVDSNLDGAACCRALAAIDHLAGVPIVLMVTKGDDAEDRLARAPNVVDYITKPFSPEAVAAVVTHLVEIATFRKRRGGGRTPAGGGAVAGRRAGAVDRRAAGRADDDAARRGASTLRRAARRSRATDRGLPAGKRQVGPDRAGPRRSRRRHAGKDDLDLACAAAAHHADGRGHRCARGRVVGDHGQRGAVVAAGQVADRPSSDQLDGNPGRVPGLSRTDSARQTELPPRIEAGAHVENLRAAGQDRLRGRRRHRRGSCCSGGSRSRRARSRPRR